MHCSTYRKWDLVSNILASVPGPYINCLIVRGLPLFIERSITLSGFYIICICDVMLVLCLPMLSLTVVLRVLEKKYYKFNVLVGQCNCTEYS